MALELYTLLSTVDLFIRLLSNFMQHIVAKVASCFNTFVHT